VETTKHKIKNNRDDFKQTNMPFCCIAFGHPRLTKAITVWQEKV
jgi:hypothetical protein